MITLAARVAAAIGAILTILAATIVPATAADGWTSDTTASTATTSGYPYSTGSSSSMSLPICVQMVNTASDVPGYAAWRSWDTSKLWIKQVSDCRGPLALEIHVYQEYRGTDAALGRAFVYKGADNIPYFCKVYLNRSYRNRPGTYYDWQGTLAHEVGHCLGLPHVRRYSIMNTPDLALVYPTSWDRWSRDYYWTRYR